MIEDILYTTLSTKTLVTVLIVLSVYVLGRLGGKRTVSRRHYVTQGRNAATNRKNSLELVADRRAKDLKSEINRLSDVNTRYLRFIINFPGIVKNLYSTTDLKELTTTLTRLTRDIIPADLIEIYLFDRQRNILKKINNGSKNPVEVTYSIGEGLVGKAAEHRTIKVRGTNGNGIMGDSIQRKTTGVQVKDDERLWMASPIIFKDQIFGVITIGKVKNSSNNEKPLLKLISDIAGVTLINQRQLKGWQDEATTDPLTGLYNRRFFYHRALSLAEISIREGTPLSFFIFDIDHFKHYNDTNGHPAGDCLLKELSRLILAITRKSSVAARFGGEEFIVMLPGISKDDAYIYAERARTGISEHPFAFHKTQPLGFISISGGVATFPQDGNSIDTVIKKADDALYEAKKNGRNSVVIHRDLSFTH